MAEGIEVIPKMITRDGIDHGNRRRDDETRRLPNRCGSTRGCLHNSFAKANPRFCQNLAAIDAAADEFDDLSIFRECSVMQ